jgi:Ca2+-binding EF-hand superfamily protein
MSDESTQDIPMAECGACRAIIPLDSESCSSCGIRFGGVSEESLGECGACGKLQPVDSEKCIGCGVSFVGEEPEIDEEIAPAEVSEENDAEDEIDEVSDDAIQDDEPEDDTAIESDSGDSEDATEDDAAADSEGEDGSDLQEDSEQEAAIESEGEDSEDATEDDAAADSEGEDGADLQEDSEQEAAIESEGEDSEDTTEDDAEADPEGEEEADLQDDSGEEDDDLNNMKYWRTTVVVAFENLALAIAESGMTASEAFVAVDGNDDNLIDAPELQKGIEEISGEWLTANQVEAILEYLDTNENNRVDPHELVKALEDLKIGIKPGKMPKPKKEKEFPSIVQKFLMGKSANDIYYPIAYFLMVTFIGIWVVNGTGLLVDGTGGTIIYEGHSDSSGEVDYANWNICESGIENIPDPCFGLVFKGGLYPCDPAIDPGECSNSLTLFSGDNGASSMPSGFYTDGIIMIILGIIGLAAITFLHLVYAPSLRNKVSGKDSEQEDSSTSSDEGDQSESPLYKLGMAALGNDMSIRDIFEAMDTNDDGRIDGPELQKGIEGISGDMLSPSEVMELLSTLDEDSDGRIDPMELVRAIESLKLDISSDNSDSTDEEDSEEDEEDEEDSEDDEEDSEDDEEDEIDVGDWVGIEIDGKEVFGEIVEFDDDESTVTIETEDGDEITGDQGDMFLVEEDDE